MNTTPFLSDDSLMPSWSKAHGGKKMSEVPDEYLLWVYENNKCDPAVKWYVERNIDAIKSNIRQQKNNKRHWNTYNSK